MAKYAYLANGILHISKSEEIAKTHGKDGKYVETDFPSKGGYPINEDEENLVLFAEDFEKHERDIPEKLAELYRLLK